MVIALLILHGLVGVALLGAITHQAVSLRTSAAAGAPSFLARYSRVSSRSFCRAVMVLFALSVLLGAIIYPAYRLDVRVPLEELQLGWAVGMFKVKEHFGGIGLATLPLYGYHWEAERVASELFARKVVTWLLAFIVWFTFLAGHVLNNLRGLGT